MLRGSRVWAAGPLGSVAKQAARAPAPEYGAEPSTGQAGAAQRTGGTGWGNTKAGQYVSAGIGEAGIRCQPLLTLAQNARGRFPDTFSDNRKPHSLGACADTSCSWLPQCFAPESLPARREPEAVGIVLGTPEGPTSDSQPSLPVDADIRKECRIEVTSPAHRPVRLLGQRRDFYFPPSTDDAMSGKVFPRWLARGVCLCVSVAPSAPPPGHTSAG